jgi:hypothetical protein
MIPGPDRPLDFAEGTGSSREPPCSGQADIEDQLEEAILEV